MVSSIINTSQWSFNWPANIDTLWLTKVYGLLWDSLCVIHSMGLDKYMAYIWHVSTTTVSYVIVNFLKKAQILISRYLSLIKTHVGREKKKNRYCLYMKCPHRKIYLLPYTESRKRVFQTFLFLIKIAYPGLQVLVGIGLFSAQSLEWIWKNWHCFS